MKLMLDVTKNDFHDLNVIAGDLGLDVEIFCRKLLENTVVRRKEMVKLLNVVGDENKVTVKDLMVALSELDQSLEVRMQIPDYGVESRIGWVGLGHQHWVGLDLAHDELCVVLEGENV